MAVTAAGVAERLALVRRRVEGAGGDWDRLTVVAVTKGLGPDAVVAARANGLDDLGENYAQELARRAGEEGGAGARWHLLGAVQRNKVAKVAPLVHLWQAVDRGAAGTEIARRRPAAAVLVQVNVSGEEQKAGCSFDEAAGLVAELRALGLDVRGLMAVGPHGPPESARPGFRRLAGLADDLGLPERSMGMTADLEVAVEEGATMIRIGTGLFGPRPARDHLRR